jgi:hypothetical protein
MKTKLVNPNRVVLLSLMYSTLGIIQSFTYQYFIKKHYFTTINYKTMQTQNKILAQFNSLELNKKILDSFYAKYELDDFNYTPGRNDYLPEFLENFTHIDTIIYEDKVRIQGWFKHPNLDKDIYLPNCIVREFNPEHGIFITFTIKITGE